jgi:hypothetical protein
MSPSKPPSSADVDPGLTHQLYVTHCLHDEGVFRQAGFNVRATSTQDPLVLRFAREYPPYEPPLGLRGGDRGRGDLPRRLALVRVPGGRSVLVHSAYLPDDGRGRANNFFSHVLARPGLTAREALTTWASPGWVEGCEVAAGVGLPPLDGLPAPGPITDDLVTAFLRPEKIAAGGGLGDLVCPERLAHSPGRRRELAAQVLRGCLRVLRAGPLAPRARLYLLAEPGLVALLTYAAARLLPEALAAELTFSTYENAHRDLRLYRHAAVVGTWTADPARGLAQEFFIARGYGLNTVSYRSSPELDADDGDVKVEEWIELAAAGDWATVDKAHRMLGKMTTTAVSFSEGLEAARLLRLVTAGEPAAEDLLTLRRSPWGPAILQRHGDRVWPRVRDGSLTDPRLREAFADLLRERLGELEETAARALREGAPDWQAHWQRIAELVRGDPARLREAFQKMLPDPPYAPALRLALLRQLHGLPAAPANGKSVLSPLLRGCTADDFDLLAGSGLPRGWLARAVCYALLETDTQAAAALRVHAGDEDLLRAFWEQLLLLREESPRRALLAPLFPPSDPRSVRLFSRVLRARLTLPAETLAWLLERLGAWGPDWDAFWGSDDHRGLLLDLLRQLGEAAGPLWERLCGPLDRDVLLPGSPRRGLLLDLIATLGRPGPSVPPAFAEVIRDWAVLHDHFEKAAAVADEGSRAAVIAACNRRGLDPVPLLAGYFERFVRPQGMKPEVLDDFAGFFHTFYAGGADYQDHASRLIGWLRVVEGCPEEARAPYQLYYLERFVPAEFRWRLAEEELQAGRLLPAAHAAVPKLTRPGTPLPARAAWAAGKRWPWLLGGFAAGATAAAVTAALARLLLR